MNTGLNIEANPTQRAYSEYNKVLPQYKKAEELQKQCHEQADEIAKLKEELKAGKMVNGNDLDANYWKAKYETILAQINRR